MKKPSLYQGGAVDHSGQADTGIIPDARTPLARPSAALTTEFHEFLSRAAAGDPSAQRHMNATLRTASLRDGRYRRRPLDLERAQQEHAALRAAERALIALARYRCCVEQRERVRRA